MGHGGVLAAAGPAGGAGWVYTVTAVLAGAWFLYESHALYNRAQPGCPTRAP